MYILKNAFRNITRNKGRNILIGVVLLVIASACTVSLAIHNTANNLIQSYKDAYQVEATISFSRNQMMNKFEYGKQEGMDEMKDAFANIPTLTIEDVENYAESAYVKSFSYTYSIGVSGNNIEKVSTDFSFDKNGRGPSGKIDNQTDFTLNSYNNLENMEEFINGNYQITESDDDIWNKLFLGNYCLVSEELKTLNDLNIGDEIEVVDDNSNSYLLEIVGFYEETSSDEMSMFSNSANNIITNTEVVGEIASNSTPNGTINPTFILNSYDDSTPFLEELYTKGLSTYYTLSTNEDEVSSATSSISNVSSFAITFLIITFIIGAIVLFVINQINLRERKYEIGVLRTIGMKKSLLTMQFVSELLMVTTVSLVIGFMVGAFLSKPIGNSLLASEINSSEQRIEDIGSNFGGKLEEMPNRGEVGDRGGMRGVVSVQAYDKIDAVVDIKVLLQLLGLGICLTLVSSISSMLSIQRFAPLQILKERS